MFVTHPYWFAFQSAVTRTVLLSITKENFQKFFTEAPEAIADFEVKLARYAFCFSLGLVRFRMLCLLLACWMRCEWFR